VVYCIRYFDTNLIFDVHDDSIEIMSSGIGYRYIFSTDG